MKSGDESPCTDDQGITAYFNKANVKQQLHITTDINWSPCSEEVGKKYKMGATSLDLFEDLKKAKLSILLYSGNVDGVVPYVETE